MPKLEVSVDMLEVSDRHIDKNHIFVVWLVVSTHPKNMSQVGSSSQERLRKTHVTCALATSQ